MTDQNSGETYEAKVKAITFDPAKLKKAERTGFTVGVMVARDAAASIAAKADAEILALREALKDDEHIIRLVDVSRAALLKLSLSSAATKEEAISVMHGVFVEIQAALRQVDKARSKETP